MTFTTRKTLLAGSIAVVAAVAALGGFVWSGTYNVGADDRHTRPVHALLETLRERSIHARAGDLQVPADLASAERIQQGAGNYDAMCTGCHLAPGKAESELSKGLYPAPPNLSKEKVDPAEAFWVIKHGIKASGMPAWGKSMDDEYIWNMAAFLQELPVMDEAKYRSLVASSGGHSHGGGESMPHGDAGDHHQPGGDDHHGDKQSAAGHDDAAGNHHAAESAPSVQGEVHRHADGKEHVHAAPAKPSSPVKQPPSVAPSPAPAQEPAQEQEPAPEDEHANHEHQH